MTVSRAGGTGGKPEGPIGLAEAWERIRGGVAPMAGEEMLLDGALLRVLAEAVAARVDSPDGDVSLKDGYAVRAADTAEGSGPAPARLRVLGSRYAGGGEGPEVGAGTAVQVTSGAVLPRGADAVVGVEYCSVSGAEVEIGAPVVSGQNVLPRGTDIRSGERLGRPGDLLTPGRLGWLAAAGVDRVRVHARPRIALVATGDEVVAPGRPLGGGQIYASNLVTLSAWLRAFGLESSLRVLPDRADRLREVLPRELERAEVLMTSGGAWGSERDLVVRVLDELGWRKVFHRVRLGPGKAVGFGLLEGRPVFCLPGGPPSNEMAFLQLALPGVLRMAGWTTPPFPCLTARLTRPLQGRQIDWTQVSRGLLSQGPDGTFEATPYKPASRLESMARAECLILLPEGTERLEVGEPVQVQLLAPAGGPIPD